MKKITILFWKAYAIIWDLRPRKHLPKYSNYPIASCDISKVHNNGIGLYSYPEGIKVLYEWDEKGHHWIVFTR